MYLVLGCVLVENIITNDKSNIHEGITEALRALKNSYDYNISVEQKMAYLEAEGDFTSIILTIQQRKASLTREDPSLNIKNTIKHFYEGYISNPRHAKTIIIATRGVLLNYLLKSSERSDESLKYQLLNDKDWVSDIYLKDMCQLFAVVFDYKINFLEVQSASGSMGKTECYPKTGSNSFSFVITILRVRDKEQDYKAFAYPVSQSAIKKSILQQEVVSNEKATEQVNKRQQEDLAPSSTEANIEDYSTSPLKQSISQYEDHKPCEQTITTDKQIPTTIATQYEEELAGCSVCQAPLKKSELFVNRVCGDRYCIYCIEDNYVFSTLCLNRSCFTSLDTEGIQIFISIKRSENVEVQQQQPQQQPSTTNTTPKKEVLKESPPKQQTDYINCNACFCHNDKSKMFENSCGHFYCTNCIQRNIEFGRKFCFAAACTKYLDSSALNDFFDKLITDDMRVMIVVCKACSTENQFEYQKTSKPDYFKCGGCTLVSCLKHEDVMSKCLCYCDTCLHSLEFNLNNFSKSCRKCHKGYCSVCGEKRTAVGDICKCVCLFCFGKKANESDKICSACLNKPACCPNCNDVLDSYNEYAQICGHVICLTCERLQIQEQDIVKKADYSCLICATLNKEMNT